MAVVLAVLGVLLAGCSGPDRTEAASVAARFVASAGIHPDAACRMLAPATLQELEQQEKSRCVDVLPGLGIDGADAIGEVSVYVTEAQVVLPNQTVFLSRFDAGWKVVAAGCTTGGSDPEEPYTCLLKGR